jgi:hypothetical protein
MLSCLGNTKSILVPAEENDAKENFRKVIVAMLAAALFVLGLAIGEVVLPSKILDFLTLYTFATGTYDPTLLIVMMGGVVVSFIAYQFIQGWGVLPNPFARECPLTARKFSVPTNTTLNV